MTELEELVFTALGAASTCWSDLDKAGVFNPTRAKEIGDELIANIRVLSDKGELY